MSTGWGPCGLLFESVHRPISAILESDRELVLRSDLIDKTFLFLIGYPQRTSKAGVNSLLYLLLLYGTKQE